MNNMKTDFYLILILTSVLSLLTNPCFAQKFSGGVFVLGGIHQAHEKAKLYTYKRMGEIYKELNPDILLVETQQKYVSDSSYIGTPYDFIRFMIPLALKDKKPIYGIDWWDDEKGKKWVELQQEFYKEDTFKDEADLLRNIYRNLSKYFIKKDFRDINSQYITNLWEARSEFKYHIYSQHPKYKFIAEFENERNNHIVDNILKIVKENPNRKILIAIGIDHKYYIEKELEKYDVKVYQVENIEHF